MDDGAHLGLRRSLRLLAAFRHEQADPAHFYRVLADDSVRHISRFLDLDGADVLDVGGGPGWFAEAFAGAGARYWAVEHDLGELMAGRDQHRLTALVADGSDLPFPDARFDLCYSSNVLEHVEDWSALLEELVRTVRPGGIVFCAFTNWLSPWGGHETSPWHYLGGAWAARRYERRHGHPPKNRYGSTLFPVHVGQVLRWAHHQPGVDLIDARPRYYPSWCQPLVSVPGLREVATWNLATVLRRE